MANRPEGWDGIKAGYCHQSECSPKNCVTCINAIETGADALLACAEVHPNRRDEPIPLITQIPVHHTAYVVLIKDEEIKS